MSEGKPTAMKRKQEPAEGVWADEDELKQIQEKKRKLEEAEPFNTAAARKKAREVGMEEARRRSLSDVSKRSSNVPPRGLSIEGDSSSEFVSAVEDAGGATSPALISKRTAGRQLHHRMRKDKQRLKKRLKKHDVATDLQDQDR
ncbi:hypothetical protein LTR37_007204 [Vermiconidia calcicola]|uniref:Uncharacterized protein n=1 Tax=Vermiconidia calcicola TaxID=1690605 RepID=A0ACC3NDV2_9PEZI|nr:hypothetical protein LTR37_007204 [Vermiconidia calcicola]